MQPLWAQWDRVAEKLRVTSHRVFLFDFDGTLAPIAPTPAQVRVTPIVRRQLRDLSNQRGVQVGVVSGRSLRDLRGRIRLARLLYVGNHGFEFQSGRRRWAHPSARRRSRSFPRLKRALTKALSSIPGVLIEDKGLTLSVHWRGVTRNLRPRVRRGVRKTLASFNRLHLWNLRAGKMLLEIRPALPWDKGSAVALLRHRCPADAKVLYVGDDATDEDAFRAVGPGGIAVHVGRGRSSAPYYLRGQEDVSTLLERLMTV